MCKHLIGMAIRLKLAKPPPAAKNVPINEKSPRGRPNVTSRVARINELILLNNFF